jgi:hypothetical protein
LSGNLAKLYNVLSGGLCDFYKIYKPGTSGSLLWS